MEEEDHLLFLQQIYIGVSGAHGLLFFHVVAFESYVVQISMTFVVSYIDIWGVKCLIQSYSCMPSRSS